MPGCDACLVFRSLLLRGCFGGRAGSVLGLFRRLGGQGGAKPGGAQTNILLDGFDTNVQDGRDFGHLESAEVFELHGPGFTGIDSREFFEGFIESQQIHRTRLDGRLSILEGNQGSAGATLGRAMAARVVDENLAHVLGGDGDKMRAAFPIGPGTLLHEPQKGFVDQSGGLQGVSRTLAAEIRSRQPAQFPIDNGGYLDQSGFVALAPVLQQDGDWDFRGPLLHLG